MAIEQIDSARNLVITCTMVLSLSLAPELSESFIRPAMRSWKRLKHFALVMKERFQRKCQSSFWEIDMTKFEP